MLKRAATQRRERGKAHICVSTPGVGRLTAHGIAPKQRAAHLRKERLRRWHEPRRMFNPLSD
jgi:hypothetical protein